MQNRKLLLLGNSQNPGQEFLAHAREQIRDLLGDRANTLLFIPFASVLTSYDDYTSRVRAGFREIGYAVQSLHQAGDPHHAIREAQAIVVGGGNTFHLLHALYQNDLIGEIRERVNAGVPYIGWSAGSNIACPSIRTTNDMPIVEPASLEALGLVPFQINPHFIDCRLPGDPAESRAERLAEFVEVNPNCYVVGLREGTMLRVEASMVRSFGSQKVCVFVKGKPPSDYGPNDSLEFLLAAEDWHAPKHGTQVPVHAPAQPFRPRRLA
jgi:dipeptidase E